MPAPFEILAASMTAWVATTENTSEPQITDTTLTGFTKLGANGSDNYDEEGVQVAHTQDFKEHMGLGKNGPLKVWRDKEQMTVNLTLYDLTAAQYGLVMNNSTVTTTAQGGGSPGRRRFPLYQGYTVDLVTLLIRTDVSSPYGDSWKMQYWLPVVYQAGEPEPTYKKGEAAGLKLLFKGLYDQTNGFGQFAAQYQDAA